MEEAEYKAINFDFRIRSLTKYYPGQSYRQAYKEVKKYLEQNGFEHRQWSGYISSEKLTAIEVADVVNDLFFLSPWIPLCAKRFDVTDAPKYRLDALERFNDLVQGNKTLNEAFKEYERNEALRKSRKSLKEISELGQERQKRRRPIREALAEAQRSADEYNAKLGIQPISKDDLEL